MRVPRRNLIRLGFVAVATLAAVPVLAQRDHDQRIASEHDHARHAVERGEALPLADILAQVRPDLGGELVDVSFKRKEGRWTYEFKVVDLSGRLTEIYVDAATARILKREME